MKTTIRNPLCFIAFLKSFWDTQLPFGILITPRLCVGIPIPPHFQQNGKSSKVFLFSCSTLRSAPKDFQKAHFSLFLFSRVTEKLRILILEEIFFFSFDFAYGLELLQILTLMDLLLRAILS